MVSVEPEYSCFNSLPSRGRMTRAGLVAPVRVSFKSVGGSKSFSYAPPYLNFGSANRLRVEPDAVAGTEAVSAAGNGFSVFTDALLRFIHSLMASIFL